MMHSVYFHYKFKKKKINLNKGKLHIHMQNKSFKIQVHAENHLKKCINPIGHVKLYIKSFPLSEFISELRAGAWIRAGWGPASLSRFGQAGWREEPQAVGGMALPPISGGWGEKDWGWGGPGGGSTGCWPAGPAP